MKNNHLFIFCLVFSYLLGLFCGYDREIDLKRKITIFGFKTIPSGDRCRYKTNVIDLIDECGLQTGDSFVIEGKKK